MEKGITKEQSKALQGLAILMMLYHHLFSTPEALGVQYHSLLNIGGVNIELRMAWFFKICVGIYAFVSGYGLAKSSATQSPSYDDSFGKILFKDYKFVLKKLFSFFLQYWLVFILFVPIGFIFFGKPVVISELLLNLFGISSSYNGAWWYVFQYMKMLLVFPLIDCFLMIYKNKSARRIWGIFYAVLFVALIVVFMINKDVVFGALEFFQPAFFLCFIVGIVIARLKLYELCSKILPEKLLYILGILGFILVIAARVKIAKDASSAGLDFVFVPVFAFGFSVIVYMLPKVSDFFCFFGGLSTYMWLTHVFFYDHYAKKLVMCSKVSLGIYLTLVLLSAVSALVLGKIYVLLRKGVSKISKN